MRQVSLAFVLTALGLAGVTGYGLVMVLRPGIYTSRPGSWGPGPAPSAGRVRAVGWLLLALAWAIALLLAARLLGLLALP